MTDMTKDEGEDQLIQALRLFHNMVRFNHMPPGTGRLCTAVHADGMVEIEGMTGHFAPHLFQIDGEVATVPVLGKVN